MGTRSEFSTLLKAIPGVVKVYFQPPPSVTMQYPAIVYSRERIDIVHADNIPYKHLKRYQVTVIDGDPDSNIPDLVAKLPMCSFDRHFTADNLNHDVFNIYF